MRHHAPRRLLFGSASLVALLVAPVALAAPVAPSVRYPSGTLGTNIRVNPTIFLTPFSDPASLATKQEDFEVQIATRDTFDAAAVVWQTLPGLGAGMAVHVDDRSGVFQNALQCRTELEYGKTYFVRARQKARGGAFTPYSAAASFTTVAPYGPAGGGTTRYLQPGGTDAGNCANPAQPCRTLGYALSRVTSGAGDDILVAPGIYPMSQGQVTFTDFPDRVRVRAGDPANRPVFKANYAPSGTSNFATMNNAADVIWQDLVFEGADNCCPAYAQNSYQMNVVGNARVSYVRVSFLKGMRLTGSLDKALPGARDILFDGAEFVGFPLATSFILNQRTYDGYQERNPSYLTIIRSRFDNLSNHFTTRGCVDVLLEDTVMSRGLIHPLRPEGVNQNWTVRRFVMDDGLEGFNFSTVDSTIFNLVVENSTFRLPLVLSDNGQHPGTVGYLVLRDNVFMENGGWRLQDCAEGNNPACVSVRQGGTADVYDATKDRLDIDHNVYWRSIDTRDILTFDDVVYSRRGSPSYQDYLSATGFDASSPFQLYGSPARKDTVDPQFTRVQIDDPSNVSDFTPKPGSPLIDAGDAAVAVPEGGGARVDVGKVEYLLAPLVEAIDPAANEQCAVVGSGAILVRVTDAQEAIDLSTIQASVNGSTVVPGLSGSGGQITLSLPVPGGFPPGGTLAVQVTASDTASPAHATTKSFCFYVAPPAPSGVTAS